MERKVEAERKKMEEQLRKDVEQAEQEEERKYERKLATMKAEISEQCNSLNMESEL